MRNIELGSEFDLALNKLNLVSDNLLNCLRINNTEWYNYGRTAIRQIPILKQKKVLLPEFICDSVIECFSREQIIFYNVNQDLSLDVSDILEKTDKNVGYIYVAHYFGYIQSEKDMQLIRKYADENGIIIIEDITQSLFSDISYIGDYLIASVRKWGPIPQGGILCVNNEKFVSEKNILSVSDDNTKAYGMVLKNMFLNDNYDTNEKYRNIFAESENKIDTNLEQKKISDFAMFIIQCIDIGELVQRRKKNLIRLQGGLEKIGIMPIKKFRDEECPLVFPIKVRNRDDFRKYLIENRIYCAVHWPYTQWYGINRKNAELNAQTLISLPLDQRYGDKEIDYLIKTIKKYRGELLF